MPKSISDIDITLTEEIKIRHAVRIPIDRPPEGFEHLSRGIVGGLAVEFACDVMAAFSKFVRVAEEARQQWKASHPSVILRRPWNRLRCRIRQLAGKPIIHNGGDMGPERHRDCGVASCGEQPDPAVKIVLKRVRSPSLILDRGLPLSVP